MPSYYANEAVFDLPERPFVDKTVHALDANLPDDKTLAVFVRRRPIEAGKSLRALVDEHVTLNQTRLHAFTVLDEAEDLVGGLPGVILRTRWRHHRETFYQLQAHVPFGDVLVVFAVIGPDTERPACEETFASILQTVTWRTA